MDGLLREAEDKAEFQGRLTLPKLVNYIQ
jgi:hypothetical protein